jgi:hypothetical protein
MLNNSAPFQTDPMFADPANASIYVQTNLVSDLSELDAKVTDPNLKNPWGVSFFDGSPFWISDQGKDVATLYEVTGSTGTDVSQRPLVVSIPPDASPHGPTGQVTARLSTAPTSSSPISTGRSPPGAAGHRRPPR